MIKHVWKVPRITLERQVRTSLECCSAKGAWRVGSAGYSSVCGLPTFHGASLAPGVDPPAWEQRPSMLCADVGPPRRPAFVETAVPRCTAHRAAPYGRRQYSSSALYSVWTVSPDPWTLVPGLLSRHLLCRAAPRAWRGCGAPPGHAAPRAPGHPASRRPVAKAAPGFKATLRDTASAHSSCITGTRNESR